MGKKALIQINKEKCNNCHSCISVCPVKHCIDGSGDKIKIIDERCIGCGRCIAACTRHARSLACDTEEFFTDLKAGEPIVVMAAPSAVTVFNDIFKLFGFLKSLGVLVVFDVSFGGELTVKSYLEYAKKEKPKLIIAQPCAAVVTFCEIYEPHLIPYLAPAHSPMLHTAIMIRNFFPEYKNAKIAAISPCAAKKREFEETGFVDYNVSMTGLKKYIKAHNIDINSFNAVDFVGPVAERAAGFSSPGGLMDTVLRDAPELEDKIRRIEGTDTVYKYLNEIPNMLKNGNAPFLVDCLSCAAGCNGGPGTENYGHPIDVIESKVEKRIKEQCKKSKTVFGFNKIKYSIHKYWKPNLYDRDYQNLSERLLGYRIPTEKDLGSLYSKMKKYTEADFLNCSACGYGNCKGMAEAIYNNLNRPENCHQYLKNDVDERLGEHINIMENVKDGIFLIDRSRLILPSYSNMLEEIFRRDKLAGLPVIDVLSGFIDKSKITEIREFLDKAFEPTAPRSEIENNNPLHFIDASFLNLDGDYDIVPLEFIIVPIGTSDTVEKLFIMVHDLSERRIIEHTIDSTKKNVRIQIDKIEDTVTNPDARKKIDEIIIYLIDNSVNYSLSDADKHNGKKNIEAHISVTSVKDDESVHFSFIDDSSGMDYNTLAVQAAENGIIDKGKIDVLQPKEKLALIFDKNIHSKPEDNYASLFPVKRKIKELGGNKINLKTKAGEFFQLDFSIPLDKLV
ncbi:hypothetical protein AGMMS50212_08030 [Spirochaetia bacterium]|nr:hypothetical protein AGMMS50212_08030 [Spirochaetia bacterium]